MKLLKKIFGKKALTEGIMGISFLEDGMAVAIAGYRPDKSVQLNYCEFIKGNAADCREALQQIGTIYDFTAYDGCIVLNGNDYRRINMEAPPVTPEEMPDALRWKIADTLEFPMANAVIDYYPVPTAKRHNGAQVIEIIVSPADLLKDRIEKCAQAQLDVKIIDVQETSLRNLARLLPENEQGVAILYLQESYGAMTIAKAGIIYLYRKFEIGYQSLDLGHFSENFEEVLQQQNNLALEIQRSMDYVESYYGIPAITSLVVVPLVEYTQTLTTLLSDQHGITSRIMDLSAIVNTDILLTDATQSYCCPAIGATLRERSVKL